MTDHEYAVEDDHDTTFEITFTHILAMAATLAVLIIGIAALDHGRSPTSGFSDAIESSLKVTS